jgi:hypothetical protein
MRTGANMHTEMAVDSGYKTLPLSMLQESSTNPRRTFEPTKLVELADYVSGHIMGFMFRKRLCGRCGGKPHGCWRCAF